jgi:hypothetical protein
MRSRILVAAAVTGLASGVSAAPLWTVERSEIAYLLFGEPGKPVLSISCGQEDGETGRDETRIEVEVETGTKPGKDKVVLRVDQENGHQDVPLTPLICGSVSECQSQPNGEVYRYEASVPGKTLALEIVSKAKVLSIDAPGAKFAAPADPAAFKKFRVSCLNW